MFVLNPEFLVLRFMDLLAVVLTLSLVLVVSYPVSNFVSHEIIHREVEEIHGKII